MMMVVRLISFVMIGLLIAPQLASALDNPSPNAKDSRVRFVNYDPDNVVRIVGTKRTAIQIVFAPDEIIDLVAVGDTITWETKTSQNILILKMREIKPPTNMQVVTIKGSTRQTYQFELIPREGGISSKQKNVFFKVTFKYPQTEALRARQAKLDAGVRQKKAAIDAYLNVGNSPKTVVRRQKATKKRKKSISRPTTKTTKSRKARSSKPKIRWAKGINFAYVASGGKELQPTRAYDNGFKTTFLFSNRQTIPGIFIVDPDGRERTPNFKVFSGNRVVIQETGDKFIIRWGNLQTCIYRLIRLKHPPQNPTKTASRHVKRRVTR